MLTSDEIIKEWGLESDDQYLRDCGITIRSREDTLYIIPQDRVEAFIGFMTLYIGVKGDTNYQFYDLSDEWAHLSPYGLIDKIEKFGPWMFNTVPYDAYYDEVTKNESNSE